VVPAENIDADAHGSDGPYSTNYCIYDLVTGSASIPIGDNLWMEVCGDEIYLNDDDVATTILNDDDISKSVRYYSKPLNTAPGSCGWR
jgi:hypothetical protein